MSYLGRKGSPAPLVSSDIPDNSITGAKIVTDTIAAGDIGTDAVGADELANNAVDTNAIADDAITGGKLANDIAISTTGSITTTGAFTSVGIDDNADATAITIDSSENIVFGHTTGEHTIRVLAGTSNACKLQMGDSGSGTQCQFVYNNSNDSLGIRVNGSGSDSINISSSGNVGIGTAASADRLYVSGDIRGDAASRKLWFNYLKGNAGDNMHIDAYTGMNIYLGYYTQTNIKGAGGSNLHSQSDERLKENISTLSNSLTKLKTIRGVNFKWKENTWPGDQIKDDDGNRKNQIGVIAQEVEVEFPELVDEGMARFKDESAEDGWSNVEGYKYVGTGEFVPYLIEAVKELSATNDALEARILTLENA